MFGNIGTPELLVILVVLILLFGGKKLPELTRGIVNSIKEFRSAYNEGEKSASKKSEEE